MPELDDLKLEIQALKIVVNNLKTKETNRLKKNYDSTYNTLRGAILKTSDIENTIDNTYEKLGIAGLFEDLIVINNPYGNALGFKFSKVIEANVKNILINSLNIQMASNRLFHQ